MPLNMFCDQFLSSCTFYNGIMLDDFDRAVACGNNLYYTAADATRKRWPLAIIAVAGVCRS